MLSSNIFNKSLITEFLSKINKENISILCKNQIQNLEIITNDDQVSNKCKSRKRINYSIGFNENKEKTCTIIKLSKPLCNRFEKDTLFEYLQDALKEKDIDYILIKDKLDQLNGILIVSKTECQNYWSLKLICTNLKGTGHILFGLYLYALKKINQKIGILELAQGYANMSGFCLYSKFGFEENFELDCEEYIKDDNLGNVKMTVDMNKLTKIKIINIILGKEKFEHQLCNKEENLELQQQFQNKYEKKINDKYNKNISWKNDDYMKQMLTTKKIDIITSKKYDNDDRPPKRARRSDGKNKKKRSKK